MAQRSEIEWTDATWNPVRGCTRVSEGCRNCYAEILAARFNKPDQWGHGFAQTVITSAGAIDHRWTGKVSLIESQLDLPLRWKQPRNIFVNSTSDLFHEALPEADLHRVFAIMALAPMHTFQVLTKRAERMRDYCSKDWTYESVYCEMGNLGERLLGDPHPYRLFYPNGMPWPLPNVWLGVSVEDQERAEERIPLLLDTPAAVRFISAEPLLGPIDVTRLRGGTLDALDGHDFEAIGDIRDAGVLSRTKHSPGLDWVIVGGESGHDARPMHPEWARALRDQCAAAGVPFFFKQWGEWAVAPEHLNYSDAIGWAVDIGTPWRMADRIQHNSSGHTFARVGKTRSGRTLDGVEHNGFPKVGA